MKQLTDAEVAVVYDALGMARTHIRENRPDIAESYGTPNIDSAQEKIESLLAPNVSGLVVLTHAELERRMLKAYRDGLEDRECY